jgi:IS30 family transposase
MNYRQLTQDQRYQLYTCMKADWSRQNIAAEIGVYPSTIAREVKRNRSRRGYRPKQAQEKAPTRQQHHVNLRISSSTWKLIESYISQDWTPEQVSGWLFLEQRQYVSHERIYQYIYADKQAGGTHRTPPAA